MPTYSYRCTECGNAFDIQQSFTDDSLTVCPNCGGTLRKVFSAVGVTFNGSGFYRTDSRARAARRRMRGVRLVGGPRDLVVRRPRRPHRPPTSPARVLRLVILGSSSSSSSSASSTRQAPPPRPDSTKGALMLKGFREFILRGNVIDLAVAVVIGAAFTGVVNSIVNGDLQPADRRDLQRRRPQRTSPSIQDRRRADPASARCSARSSSS